MRFPLKVYSEKDASGNFHLESNMDDQLVLEQVLSWLKQVLSWLKQGLEAARKIREVLICVSFNIINDQAVSFSSFKNQRIIRTIINNILSGQ